MYKIQCRHFFPHFHSIFSYCCCEQQSLCNWMTNYTFRVKMQCVEWENMVMSSQLFECFSAHIVNILFDYKLKMQQWKRIKKKKNENWVIKKCDVYFSVRFLLSHYAYAAAVTAEKKTKAQHSENKIETDSFVCCMELL